MNVVVLLKLDGEWCRAVWMADVDVAAKFLREMQCSTPDLQSLIIDPDALIQGANVRWMA